MRSFVDGEQVIDQRARSGEGIMESAAHKAINPWFAIWMRPRATMRSILDSDPEYLVFLLGILLGISDSLGRSYAKNLGDMFTVPAIIALGAIMGPLGGLTLLYGASALITWTGKLLGGQGSYTHIRAAFAWSSVPLVWSLLLWVPGMALFGNELFTRETPRMDSNAGLQAAYACWCVLQVIVFLWSLIVFLKCLAEAQRYSTWRALLNILLSLSPLIILFLLSNRTTSLF